MYNSQNLPLSSKKIIKKTVARTLPIIILILCFGYPLFTLIIYGMFTGEKIASEIQNIKPSYASLLPPIFLIFLPVIAFCFLLFILIYIYEYYYYKLYYYNFDEEKGLIKKGVIKQATGFIRYERLQNVYVDQDFFDRLFGLYDVHYETAGETSGFYSHVDGLNKENADILTQFLLEKMKQSSSSLSKEIKEDAAITQKQNHTQNAQVKEISIADYPLSRSVIMSRTISISIFFSIIITICGLFEEVREIALYIFVFIFSFITTFIFSYIYNRIWYRNFSFTFFGDKGEIKSKVIGQSVSYLYYNRIQNINVSQSFFDRLFGIFSVAIETAGEKAGTRLIISGLPKESAEKIKNFLIVKSKEYRSGL